MSSGLFRREVLEARREDWLGSVHISPTRLGWPTAILASFVVVALAATLAFGGYTRKERASGRLVPVGGLLDVPATVPGVVTGQWISEGMAVKAGQPLIEITPDVDLPRPGGGAGERIASELESQQARLRLQLAQLKSALPRQEAGLRRQIRSLRQQSASAAAELALREHQVEDAQETLARIRPLQAARTISAIQAKQFEDRVWELRAQLEQAARNRVTIEQALADAVAELDQLPLQAGARLNEIEGALAEAAQSQARNQVLRPTLLRAPRAGIVSGLAVNPGQAIHDRQRLLSIAPAGAPFQAELWAPSQAVGAIAAGDRVAMRYDAFPYQQFGQQFGRIVEIAEAALSPEEVRSRTGVDPGAPAFRVLVALEGQQVRSGSQDLPLRVGMAVDADLLLGRRRLYELVFRPTGETR
jgi:membrane fusion protein